MPKTVIQRLEIVQIQQEQRYLLRAARLIECRVERFKEVTPIWELRERIVIGEMLQLLSALGDTFLQSCLIKAHFALRFRQTARHIVEGGRKLVEFTRTTARCSRRIIAAGQLQRRLSETGNRSGHTCDC